jgi:hypothetical protein
MVLTINKSWIKLAIALQYFESDYILRIASRCFFAIHSCYSINIWRINCHFHISKNILSIFADTVRSCIAHFFKRIIVGRILRHWKSNTNEWQKVMQHLVSYTLYQTGYLIIDSIGCNDQRENVQIIDIWRVI